MGLAYHRQLLKLETKSKTRRRRKQRPGHFLTDFDVHFTNNLKTGAARFGGKSRPSPRHPAKWATQRTPLSLP
jgi:hypothetical protein